MNSLPTNEDLMQAFTIEKISENIEKKKERISYYKAGLSGLKEIPNPDDFLAGRIAHMEAIVKDYEVCVETLEALMTVAPTQKAQTND